MRALLCVLCLALALGCAKDVSLEDVMGTLEVSTNKFNADGASTIILTTTISNDASPDRRDVVFNTTAGTFPNGKQEETVKATYVKGQLTATIALTAPMVPGTITLAAGPAFDTQSGDFKRTTIVTADPSNLSQVVINLSSLSMKNDFQSEVTITGTLKNQEGGKVSLGTLISFDLMTQPYDLSPCNCARFRSVKAVSDENGQVSAVFGVDGTFANTTLYATILYQQYPYTYYYVTPIQVQP